MVLVLRCAFNATECFEELSPMNRVIGRALILAFAFVSAAAVPAWADSFDNFTLNPDGIAPYGPVITFTLPASPTPSYVSPPPAPPYFLEPYFQLNDVAYSINGVAQIPALFTFDTNVGGGYEDIGIQGTSSSNSLALIVFSGFFFTGDVASPTFVLTNGTPFIGDNFIPNYEYEYALSIDPASSPVPEPGSWLLLGTGAVGASGVVRRRLFS